MPFYLSSLITPLPHELLFGTHSTPLLIMLLCCVCLLAISSSNPSLPPSPAGVQPVSVPPHPQHLATLATHTECAFQGEIVVDGDAYHCGADHFATLCLAACRFFLTLVTPQLASDGSSCQPYVQPVSVPLHPLLRKPQPSKTHVMCVLEGVLLLRKHKYTVALTMLPYCGCLPAIFPPSLPSWRLMGPAASLASSLSVSPYIPCTVPSSRSGASSAKPHCICILEDRLLSQ